MRYDVLKDKVLDLLVEPKDCFHIDSYNNEYAYSLHDICKELGITSNRSPVMIMTQSHNKNTPKQNCAGSLTMMVSRGVIQSYVSSSVEKSRQVYYIHNDNYDEHIELTDGIYSVEPEAPAIEVPEVRNTIFND